MGTFPTTAEIDVHSTPIINLFSTPMKAVRYTHKQAYREFLLIREAEPNLTVGEFRAAYMVSDAACVYIQQRLEAKQ